MKEYEIHTTATYSTDGGTTEGSDFAEYVTAKNLVEAKRLLRAELQAAGYKNIKLDVIEASENSLQQRSAAYCFIFMHQGQTWREGA